MKPSIPSLLFVSAAVQTRGSIFLAIALAALGPVARAQVLSPAEIADPAIRGLQQSHLAELHAITVGLASHHFPYAFYFSRRLDITEREQQRSDQRSIQFDRFQGQIVLKITGNYFAAYSAERLTNEERVGRTYYDVMLPILQAAASALAGTQVPDAFALEISHHVIRKVLGVETESVENVVLILPKASAQRLMEARDEAGRAAAILEGAAYLNAAPVSFWPGEARKSSVIQASAAPSASQRSSGESTKLQVEYRDTIARMLKELDSQAHFVLYAAPSFIEFRGAQYLQIAITTTLAASDSGSQYKLAALAFDRHIAQLIRPVLAYFKEAAGFTGIDFSTTVHLATGNADNGSEAVEFIFPWSALRGYEEFNLTGQQLLNAGVVLINGDRAELDLQTAEAVPMMQPSRSGAILDSLK